MKPKRKKVPLLVFMNQLLKMHDESLVDVNGKVMSIEHVKLVRHLTGKTMWKPINTAPTDGTAVLTDKGTACVHHGRTTMPRWYLCDTDGNIPTCAEDGVSISRIHPTAWQEMPKYLRPRNER